MKNPFEIRSDVLAMAKDYMDKQYALNLEIAKKMAGMTADAMEELPKMYTMEELMEKAKEMYKFVETK